MPRLACQTCGRQIYSVAALAALERDERRCPRCGAFFDLDRREGSRRETVRRQNPADKPGPPEGIERRERDRRSPGARRGTEKDVSTRRPSDGWQD